MSFHTTLLSPFFFVLPRACRQTLSRRLPRVFIVLCRVWVVKLPLGDKKSL